MMLLGFKRIVAAAGLLTLTACGGLMEKGDSAPSNPRDVSGVPDAVPRVEPIRPQNQKSYVVLGKRYYPLSTAKGYRETGIASWYGQKFHGRKTATGEVYDMYKMTAAHKTLPLPSYVEVKNLSNGRKIVVRVNDRGPFHGGRIIDLSYTAASKLGIIGRGTGRVEVTAIDASSYGQSKPVAPVKAIARPVEPILNTPIPKPVVNQSVSVSSDGSSVYLQVGTFSSILRAEAFMQKLSAQVDEAVFLMPLYRHQGPLYRVRVGPLTSVEASQLMAMKLKSLGVTESHAVVE